MCFAQRSVVQDEGKTIEGTAAITQWMRQTKECRHTVKPISAVERDGKTIVVATVSGSFPNSPVNLEHVFSLAGEKIASLEIRQ